MIGFPDGTPPAATIRSVAVVGSLNVDHLYFCDDEPADDSAVEVRRTAVEPGGHAGNCAGALTAWGLDVALIGAIGTDRDGRMLMADLAARGVDCSGVVELAGHPTGEVVIPVFGDRHYMLLHRGANDALSARDACRGLRPGIQAAMVFDPPPATLAAVIESAAALTPRPRVCWTPGGVAARDLRALGALSRCDMVFVNRAERADLEQTIGRELTGFPGLEVVTTLGAQGAVLECGGDRWSAPAEPVDLVDPTGAGDAFAAAYLAAHLAGLDPQSRLAQGNRAGAAAVSTAGARAYLSALARQADRARPELPSKPEHSPSSTRSERDRRPTSRGSAS